MIDLNVINIMRQDAIKIFEAGLAAVTPEKAILKHCYIDGNYLVVKNLKYDLDQFENIFVIGTGKATAAMAQTIEKLLGDRIKKGSIIVKYDHDLPLSCIKVHQAGHPIPDSKGVLGAMEILSIASEAGLKDLIICLISGGGSALMPLPVKGLSLSDKQKATQLLLNCGARIHEINSLRKHLSAIKGGRLAKKAMPAIILTLIISDVIGDDLEVIASGPTAPDPTTFRDAFETIDHYGLMQIMPSNIVNHIQQGLQYSHMETPKPGDMLFQKVQNVIIANNRDAIQGALNQAKEIGYTPLMLSSMIGGETRDVAGMHAAIAKEIVQSAKPIASPACLISGGETTVTLKGTGKGGCNQEFSLAAALELGSDGNVVVLCAGTDGTDGPTDAAGAISDTTTASRAKAIGMHMQAYLSNNDSYNFFDKLNDLIITGPTQTNVMDLRIVLVR
jgi:hydroxypyruvate reductase